MTLPLTPRPTTTNKEQQLSKEEKGKIIPNHTYVKDKDPHKIGLVLEGGGMKALYTSGVLDYFLEKDLHVPYIVGVSSGACSATSYISKQSGRNKNIIVNYIDHPQYMSVRNVLKQRSILKLDLIFRTIPLQYEPLDFKTFDASNQHFLIGTTDGHSGKPIYISKEDCSSNEWDLHEVLRASCSLPFALPSVKLNGKTLFDGAISDPLPIRKVFEDGNKKAIVILTKDNTFKIKAFKRKRLVRFFYPRYRGLASSLVKLADAYNESLRLLKQLEQQGKAFIIQPQEKVTVGRVERNKERLEGLYAQGYEDAKHCYERLNRWLAWD
ncbi:patatin-like phospholipase family protein [Longirhabdus pacifica]|uniref:patatin-like phospholipase family protein n=1 Tax=Longirhabdus pacifica TaxID=2305227 RepID=UPI001F0C9FD7|nr:patatin family protein [Longirhabdus pacifica]